MIMQIPFTIEQFLSVFAKYNHAIYPMQIVAYILGIVVVALALFKTQGSSRIVSAILAFFWLWMGIVYHIMYFSPINKAAYVFGIVYIIQGLLFIWLGVVKDRLDFHFEPNVFSIIGGILVVYAIIIYPLLGNIMGHGYPKSPGFGIAPCPTTIFTFGMLLWTAKKVPIIILIIPFLWSLVGFSAAVSLGMREDFGLIAAGILGIILIPIQNKKLPSQ
jgi:hypothetical protein